MFSHFTDPLLIDETSYQGSLTKLVRFGVFFSIGTNLFFAFFYSLRGYPAVMIWVCIIAAGIAATSLAIQHFLHHNWLAAQAVAFSIYFTVLPFTMITGGIHSSSILWMVFIPIAATVMSGSGGGLLWGGICIFTVICFYVLNEVFGIDYTVIASTGTDRLVDLLTVSLSALAASQFNERRKVHVIRQLQKIRKKLQHLAIVDPLTNAYNRRYFFNHAQIQLARAGITGHSNAVVLIDVDHFKNINDTYGHLIGDQMLMGLAAICQENLRGCDLLARFGGEEFIILLPHTELEEAQQIANRLRTIIDQKKIPTDKGPLSLTVSMGVAVSGPGEVLDLYELIIRADQAMYRAKGAGRNRVVSAD